MVNILASGPSCPWLDSQCSLGEVNQQPCLEESAQWLENVDRTNLVLASGKLVLQEMFE